MTSNTPDHENPWETPPLALDPELIETSQRLVALSEEAFPAPPHPAPIPKAEASHPQFDPKLVELERQNQYLFQRNVNLVAQVAELEVQNRRLSEDLLALKQSARSPWYLRWLRRSE